MRIFYIDVRVNEDISNGIWKREFLELFENDIKKKKKNNSQCFSCFIEKVSSKGAK